MHHVWGLKIYFKINMKKELKKKIQLGAPLCSISKFIER